MHPESLPIPIAKLLQHAVHGSALATSVSPFQPREDVAGASVYPETLEMPAVRWFSQSCNVVDSFLAGKRPFSSL